MASSAAATPAARALALAHRIDDAVRRGEITSYAEAGRRLGVTACRINQIVKLTMLAPDLQERVLIGQLGLSARELYRISGIPSWEAQRAEVGKQQSAAKK